MELAHENDIVSLFETSSEFIHVVCLFKVHFHLSGPFKLIITMLKSFQFSPVWNRYPNGSHTALTSNHLVIAYN